MPEWLTLKNGAGDVDDNSDEQIIQIARDANLPILAEINNFRDGWQVGDLHRVLSSREARENLVDNIYSNLQEHHFAGVNVDLEQLGSRDREKMVEFIEELRARLQPAGLILTQSVPTDDEAYDLKRLGALCDYIVPMVYDEHYQSGEPGPVASEDWFYNEIENLAKVLPAKKTVVGFGNYGYDWMIGSREGGAEVSYGDVIAAAEANRTGVNWDRDRENPVLRYQSGSTKHEVWFLDAMTALNQLQDISNDGFRGVALWRLGAEDPGLWTMFKRTPGLRTISMRRNYSPFQRKSPSSATAMAKCCASPIPRTMETVTSGRKRTATSRSNIRNSRLTMWSRRRLEITTKRSPSPSMTARRRLHSESARYPQPETRSRHVFCGRGERRTIPGAGPARIRRRPHHRQS